jgi:hypothetical protein
MRLSLIQSLSPAKTMPNEERKASDQLTLDVMIPISDLFPMDEFIESFPGTNFDEFRPDMSIQFCAESQVVQPAF